MKKINLLFLFIGIMNLHLFAQDFVPNGTIQNSGEFGWNTEMSGDYAFVAAPLYENTFISQEEGFAFYGAVHVYKKDNTGQWTETQRLVADDDQMESNYFGNSMMVNGNYLIVGATPVSTPGPSGGNQRDRGDVYVYKLDNSSGQWIQDAKFSRNLNNSLVEIGYGTSVAITSDGDTVFIGGDEMKVFTRDASGTAWTQQPSFAENGTIKFNQFGTMFVRTNNEVHVYQYNSSTNSFTKNQVITTSSFNRMIVDDFRLVLSRFEDGELYGNTGLPGVGYYRGTATIYEPINGSWQETQTITSQGALSSEFHVGGICGDYMVAGAHIIDDQGETPSFKRIAYVFKKNDTDQWEQIQTIDPGFGFNFGGYADVNCENLDLLIGNVRYGGGAIPASGDVAFYSLDDSCTDFVSIPDPAFEQALDDLSLNADGVIDGKICRADAEAYVNNPVDGRGLFITNYPEIKDLTGLEAFINTTAIRLLGISNLEVPVRLPQNNALTSLEISSSGAVTLENLSDVPSLKDLKILSSVVTGFDLSQNSELETVEITANLPLSDRILDLSNKSKLKSITSQGSNLTAINLDNSDELEIIQLFATDIESIDVSDKLKLNQITIVGGINEGNLEDITLPNSEALISLRLEQNKLSTLNVSGVPNVENLNVRINNLTVLDISNNTNLKRLNLESNDFQNLDDIIGLSSITSLEDIYISRNPISGDLDLSAFAALENLGVSSTNITSLNIKNGNNTFLNSLDARNTRNLNCIEIDDVGYAQSQPEIDDDPITPITGWSKDPFDQYSENCSGLKMIGQKSAFEAETFDAQQGVRIVDIAEDQGSTKAIGYLQPDDFVVYQVEVMEEGMYEMNFRLANVFSGGKITVMSNDVALAVVDVPATGGWQDWQNVTSMIVLGSGVQDLKLVFSDAPYIGNINGIEFTKIESFTSKIQAEDFTSQQGIQVVSTNGAGEGDAIGYLQPGDSASYIINMSETGSYSLHMNIATAIPHGIVTFSSNGTYVGEIQVPNTGGWSNYQVLSTNITLPAGIQELKLDFSNAAYIGNIDWLELIPLSNKSANSVVDLKTQRIDIFPNPVANGEVTISADDTVLSIELFTMNGQKVVHTFNSENTLSISQLTPGFYLVKVNTPNEIFTKKLLVK